MIVAESGNNFSLSKELFGQDADAVDEFKDDVPEVYLLKNLLKKEIDNLKLIMNNAPELKSLKMILKQYLKNILITVLRLTDCST